MEARKLIGWNLRHLRVAKGLTLERLALEAALDRSYVGRIEQGTENVTVSVLEVLSAVLDVPVRALFAEVADDAPMPPPMRAGRKPKA